MSMDSNDFRIPDLIIKKRHGQELSREEIEYFVRGVVEGYVQDAQLGAMLMAMVLKDLTNNETTCLTRAMMDSGETLQWPDSWQGTIVDKHSTGGVGDKISLVLAPALAACGMKLKGYRDVQVHTEMTYDKIAHPYAAILKKCKVPMVSGRGLGHTGGTLDKLESIPGFKVSLTLAEIRDIVNNVGCCIVGQTRELVPADQTMYAIRDVTGTVDHIGLISASIISKKAAEKINALVLDVKCGKGALYKCENSARELAKKLISIGNGLGINTVALLTRMDVPIGQSIGNALEVAEAIQCLQGIGPNDVMELVVNLGGHVLDKCGKVSSVEEGRQTVTEKIKDGSALQTFVKMIKSQGVDNSLAEALCDKDTDVWTILPKAKYTKNLSSSKSDCRDSASLYSHTEWYPEMALRVLQFTLRRKIILEQLKYHQSLSKVHQNLLNYMYDGQCPNYSTMCTKFVSGKQLLSANFISEQKCFRTKSHLAMEKKLTFLMDELKIENAVKLMKKAIAIGNIPNRTVVLNLIQLIANLGEYECLFRLHELLVAKDLITNKNFYKCVQEAYYYSGHVEKGVALLRMLYHKTRKYTDVDIFFVLITVMIVRHFPHFMHLIHNFVEDCDKMEDPLPAAGLWKTFMLTSYFEKADEIILSNQKMHTHLSQMAADLIESKHTVESDNKAVLCKLCHVPHLKNKVKTAVYLKYLQQLCLDHSWRECLDLLSEAEISGLKFPEGEVDRFCGILMNLQVKMNEEFMSGHDRIMICIKTLEKNSIFYKLKIKK